MDAGHSLCYNSDTKKLYEPNYFLESEESAMTCETINAQKAPAAVGPYCHAVKAGELVFTSGQLGLDPENGTLPDGVEAQADQALSNLDEVLKEAGLSLSDVIKTTVFLDDINDFAAINAIYEKRFGDNKPAREITLSPKKTRFPANVNSGSGFSFIVRVNGV